MAEMKVEGDIIHLDLPVRVPDLTLRLKGANVQGISIDNVPLKCVSSKEAFKSGTFLTDDDTTIFAFDPKERNVVIKLFLVC